MLKEGGWVDKPNAGLMRLYGCLEKAGNSEAPCGPLWGYKDGGKAGGQTEVKIKTETTVCRVSATRSLWSKP